MCRLVSSWVGDHQRIPAVDCFDSFFGFVYLDKRFGALVREGCKVNSWLRHATEFQLHVLG
jgi:hypothetical protein